MRSRPILVSIGSLAILAAVNAVVPSVSFAGTPAPAADAPSAGPIGRVTAAFGAMSIQGQTGERGGDLQSLLFNDDNIVTDAGGVTVLLASRVVLKVDANSSVAISEGANQTNLLVARGTVQVYVGRRPADAGSVVLRDLGGRVETLGGVFLASYDPATMVGYYACERAKVAVSSGGGGRSVTLDADTQTTIDDGVLGAAVPTDRTAFAARKRSVDRLDQSALRRTGSDTFRLRSRTLDMEVAISQLSAAGWIDRGTLAQLAQQNGVAPASGSSSSGGKSTANGSTVAAGTPASGASASAVAGDTAGTNLTPTAAPVTPDTEVEKVEKAEAAPTKADLGIAPVGVAAPKTDLGGALKDVKDVKDIKDVSKIDKEFSKIDLAPKVAVVLKNELGPGVKDVRVEATTLDVKPADLPTPNDVGLAVTVPTDKQFEKIGKSGKGEKVNEKAVKDVVDAVIKKDASRGKKEDGKPAK